MSIRATAIHDINFVITLINGGTLPMDLRAILKPARSAVAREATLVSAIIARTVCTSPSRLAIDGKIFSAVDAAPARRACGAIQ